MNGPVGTSHPQPTPGAVPVRTGPPPAQTPDVAGLRYTGESSLGPPGYQPSGIVYDSRDGETFVVENPSYLVVLAGSPLAVIDTVLLGVTSYPNYWYIEPITYDPVNDTVFVGVYPDSVAVVSGSTHAVVARLTVGFDPVSLVYDSATGDVYAGSYYVNVSTINGVSYAISTLGSWGSEGDISTDVLLGMAYDPVTQYLLIPGDTQQAVAPFGWVYAIDPVTGSTVWYWACSFPCAVSGMGVDGADGSVYVANDPITVLNGSTGATMASVSFPAADQCGLYPSTPMIYDPLSSEILVGECYQALQAISITNGTVLPPVPVGGSAGAFSVETATGDLCVLNWDTDSVAVLAPNISAVLRQVAVGGAPTAVAVDSATGVAYVLGSDNVSVFNMVTHELVRSVSVGLASSDEFGATSQAVVVDPTDNEVFVANAGSNTVTVISTATNAVTATVPVAAFPQALAWDNLTDEVYVACENSSTPGYYLPAVLEVISPRTLEVVNKFSLGSIVPAGVAFVPSVNEMFVTNSATWSPTGPELAAISATTGKVVATIALPTSASTLGQVVYDSFTGNLYVAGAGMSGDTSSPNDFIVDPATLSFVGNISVGIVPYGITTVPGTPWLLATGGANETVSLVDGTTGTVAYTVTLPMGTTPLGVAYDPTTEQVFVADFGNDSIAYLFTGAVYAVTFSESGLPPGLSLSLSLGGRAEMITTSGGVDTITFTEANGSYSFSITDISGWHQNTLPYNGSLAVGGASVTEPTMVFSEVVFPVTFSESGLPNGTNWTVDLGGRTSWSTSTIMPFTSPNGTIPFTVGPLAGFAANVSHGSIVVHNASVSVSIKFRPEPVSTSLASGFPPLAQSALIGGVVVGGAFALTIVFRSRSRTGWAAGHLPPVK
jgi:YVTN family beta-propeller protein